MIEKIKDLIDYIFYFPRDFLTWLFFRITFWLNSDMIDNNNFDEIVEDMMEEEKKKE